MFGISIDSWIGLVAAIISFVAAVVGVVQFVKKKKKKSEEKEVKEMSKKTPFQDGNQGGINISAQGDVTINGVAKGSNSGDGNHSREDLKDKNFLKKKQESIRLNDVYTSLFAEDNQLKTERIVITKQEHGNVEGYVELNEINGNKERRLSYSLKGIFANKVLTAEYQSEENRSDERGAINLKLIASNILSGFCSFSKLSIVEDEIRVSPYIWVEGENVDLLDGTYDFCTKCFQEKMVCCCASADVDMPLFLETETNTIRSILPKRQQSKKSYSKSLPEPFSQANVRQILRHDRKMESGKTETRCHFFDLESNVCKIYSGRPLDCRLFPFDIKLSDDRSEYIIGYYTDLCERELPNETIMKQHAHILRPYFFLLYPYLHIFTSDVACERLKRAEFKKIANFKEFVF